MGTAPPAAALAMPGGLQPLPRPGAPAGAQLDPSSTWRGRAGASLKPQETAPVSPHDLGQALPFWVHHTGTPSAQGKEVPRRNAPAEISPRRNAQCRAEQPRHREQRHQICSQLEMFSERGLNLITAEPEPRLRRCGCCACQMNFM